MKDVEVFWLTSRIKPLRTEVTGSDQIVLPLTVTTPATISSKVKGRSRQKPKTVFPLGQKGKLSPSLALILLNSFSSLAISEAVSSFPFIVDHGV